MTASSTQLFSSLTLLVHSELDASCEQLSRAWNRLCSTRMQGLLPIELREIIYAQIWNVEYLNATRQPSQQSGPPGHSDSRCQTHVVRPDFVGKEMALEMARAWYEAASTLTPDTFTISDTRELIKQTICEDRFRVGLDPATVLRTLTIDFDETTSRLASPYCKWPDADTRRKTFDLLHRIKKKTGFRLNFRICTPKFRLNCWPDFFDLMQPMVKTFDSEGVIVDVQAIHCSRGPHPTPYVFVDLNSLVRGHDPATWKQGVIKYLDSVILALSLSSCVYGADKQSRSVTVALGIRTDIIEGRTSRITIQTMGRRIIGTGICSKTQAYDLLILIEGCRDRIVVAMAPGDADRLSLACKWYAMLELS